MRPVTTATFALVAFLFACSSPVVTDPPPAVADVTEPEHAPTQIAWQRSLADALAIAKAESRPLLVAVNVDGESASDRIVVERYRDPEFVAATRRFACVVAHPLRHTARDWDERGRRVLCPRLGEVTCGEHVALEPTVFDRYLGGERVSPRHALIQTDGSKSFDLFLLFDLRELDAALTQAAETAPEPAIEPRWNELPIEELAARRENRARSVLEALVADLPSSKQRIAAAAAIGARGDQGSVGALRVVLARDRSTEVVAALESAAAKLGAGAVLADAARQQLFALPGKTFDEGFSGFGGDVAVLGTLARLDGASKTTRAMLLAALATAPPAEQDRVRAAAEGAFGADEVVRIVGAIEKEGGPLDLEPLLEFAREVPSRYQPLHPRTKDALPERDTAERELVDADSELTKNQDQRTAMARFGRAALTVARVRFEAGETSGLEPLFQDARLWLGRAAEGAVRDFDLEVDRMRASYYLSKFDEQEELARELVTGWPDALGDHANDEIAKLPREAQRAARCVRDARTLEALRWLGDAAARRHAERADGDPAEAAAAMARGARALGIVAASTEANEDDWTTFASFLSLLEMARAEYVATRAGVLRQPEANGLRNALNQALFRAGRVDRAGLEADRILAVHPKSAASAWYAGYAWILAAEEARRGERAKTALESYAKARERFDASLEMEKEYEATVKRNVAMCALGSGFAHLIAGDRKEAADALVEALDRDRTAGDVRDGLDREALDLVDGALEWTAKGPSSVDAVALAKELADVDRADPRWIVAVADSQLREALRADGRSPRTTEREIERRGEDGVTRKVTRTVRVPTEEGDAYMERSIAIARLARDVRDDEATRRTLAQSLTVHGERWLQRDDATRAAPLFVEASRLLGDTPTDPKGDRAAVEALGTKLRDELGAARPIARPGR